jgi:hypothetical protein
MPLISGLGMFDDESILIGELMVTENLVEWILGDEDGVISR